MRESASCALGEDVGSELVVEIVGHNPDRHPVLRHDDTVNRGHHTIYTGGATPSVLVLPVATP